RQPKPLAACMQPNLPLAEQLHGIARDLPEISPADRFTLLTILNERTHGRAKPAERQKFLDLQQLTRQSLWMWMTQKALTERVAGLSRSDRATVRRQAAAESDISESRGLRRACHRAEALKPPRQALWGGGSTMTRGDQDGSGDLSYIKKDRTR